MDRELIAGVELAVPHLPLAGEPSGGLKMTTAHGNRLTLNMTCAFLQMAPEVSPGGEDAVNVCTATAATQQSLLANQLNLSLAPKDNAYSTSQKFQ